MPSLSKETLGRRTDFSALCRKRLRLRLLQRRRQMVELGTAGRVQKIRSDRHHISERARGSLTVGSRRVDEDRERRPDRHGKGERGQPTFCVRRAFNANGVRQPFFRKHVLGKSRGDVGCERDFAMPANRRAPRERGERREAKAGGREGVGRLGWVEHETIMDEGSGNREGEEARGERREVIPLSPRVSPLLSSRLSPLVSLPLHFHHGTTGEIRPLGRR
jgi:hypothetical protein